MTTTSSSDAPAGYWIHPLTGAWCTLPWPSDPDEKAALAAMSLGPEFMAWAEGHRDSPGLIHHLTGEPWVFTPGQRRFFTLWYLLDRTGRYVYRSGIKRGAKGCGKDPCAAAWLNGELVGPTLFAGFDDRTGRPLGVQHRSPLVQVMSNSEAQSKDVLRVANAMWSREARDFYGLDCGETRTIARWNAGRLEVPPSSEASAEGDPATAIALNESHHMTTTSGGIKVAEVARRNVGKSPSYIQARAIEFTNAHQQGQDSEGERSYLAWQNQLRADYKGRKDILYDSIEADPNLSITDPQQLRLAIAQAYDDAPWTDLERKFDEIMDSRLSVADAIRYYLNGLAAAEDAWIDPAAFDSLSRPETVGDREQIAMFLDCSKSGDATGLVGCRISDGYVFVLGVWQPPHGERSKDWLAPRPEVDATVRDAFAHYRVVWFGVDPSPATDDQDESLYWAALIEGWHRDFRNKLPVWATPGVRGSAVLFDMRLSQSGGVDRNRLFTAMAERTQDDINVDKTLIHDGSSALRVHTHNAKERSNQWGMSLGKVTRDSTKRVDLAVCMVGARLGRKLALDSGKVRLHEVKRSRVIVLA